MGVGLLFAAEGAQAPAEPVVDVGFRLERMVGLTERRGRIHGVAEVFVRLFLRSCLECLLPEEKSSGRVLTEDRTLAAFPGSPPARGRGRLPGADGP